MMAVVKSHRVMCIVTVLMVSVYLYLQSDQGWIPHDEGLLGQSAERVMDGQMPHVHFDAPYTGGLAFVHAAAFNLFGVSSYATRLTLLLFSIPFTAVFYTLASRLTGHAFTAALVTLLATAWSLPNYFAGLPSWYNLFFAVFGGWCLVKYDESEKKSWLAAAGVCGGLSFLIKVSGLFFVAAGLLFLVYREHQTLPRQVDSQGDKKPERLFSFFTTTALVGFVLVLLLFVRNRLTAMDMLHFVLPGASICCLLIYNQWKHPGALGSATRFRRLLGCIGWFTIGVVAPIAVFLIPYLTSGSLGDFVQGVFVLPQKRIEWTDYPLPPLQSVLASLPLLALLLLPLLSKRSLINPWVTAIAGMLALLGVLKGAEPSVYTAVWSSARPLFPIAVTVGCVLLGSISLMFSRNRRSGYCS